jgi:hypothetical protein
MLPVHQVRKGQTWAAELLIEPDTKGMQRHLRRQASLKAGQRMGTLATQAEGMVDLVVDGLHDLTHPGQPTAPSFRPGLMAIARGRAHDLRPIALPPARMRGLPLETLITENS